MHESLKVYFYNQILVEDRLFYAFQWYGRCIDTDRHHRYHQDFLRGGRVKGKKSSIAISEGTCTCFPEKFYCYSGIGGGREKWWGWALTRSNTGNESYSLSPFVHFLVSRLTFPLLFFFWPDLLLRGGGRLLGQIPVMKVWRIRITINTQQLSSWKLPYSIKAAIKRYMFPTVFISLNSLKIKL